MSQTLAFGIPDGRPRHEAGLQPFTRRKTPVEPLRLRRSGWVKIKNRDYWRWELEREGAFNQRRERQLV
jgi:hypothetical protein